MASVVLNAGRAEVREPRRALLEGAGFRVLDASDARTALRQAAHRPNLIVLDTSLPDIDGFDVCSRLKADVSARTIPVILVTNPVNAHEESVLALSSGADWFVSELDVADTLVPTVKALIARRSAETQDHDNATAEHQRQAQKMEAIGHLAFGVAHDFNNLLTAILGYTEMMLSQIGDDKPISADLQEIRKAGDRAAALTKQLLAFSRKKPLSITVVDLNAVVSDAEQLLRRLIGEQICLQTKLRSDLWAITGDVTQLEQVLLNLVVNARDAMADGGHVYIETKNVVLSEEDQFSDPVVVTPGRYTLLTVRDTGCGMDETTRARLFEPFFTTKSQGRGTGLGLATVYGIIKHLRGYIFADSAPGEGTTFRLYIPAAVDATVTAGAEAQRMTPFVGRETVLVVEDDDAVRRYASIALRRFGYEVLEASSPERAIEISQQHDQSIHMILTDVIMPGLTGPALVRQLRQRRGGTPAIYMSGYPGDLRSATPLMEEGDAQLSKPFATDELLRSVRRVIDQARTAAAAAAK
jgi:signal transduction histidine kinase